MFTFFIQTHFKMSNFEVLTVKISICVSIRPVWILIIIYNNPYKILIFTAILTKTRNKIQKSLWSRQQKATDFVWHWNKCEKNSRVWSRFVMTAIYSCQQFKMAAGTKFCWKYPIRPWKKCPFCCCFWSCEFFFQPFSALLTTSTHWRWFVT